MEATLHLSATENGQALRTRFEELAFPLMDRLFNTALRLTGARPDAEDLVQETYLKAYRSFYRFQPGSNFSAWMYRILINNFINHYRRRQKQPVRVNFETALAIELRSDFRRATKHEGIDWRETYAELFDDTISRALYRLPVEYRLVVLLSDVNQLMYKEIAQVLGCPIGTVMSRLSRGRQKLAEILKGYAIENGFIKEKL